MGSKLISRLIAIFYEALPLGVCSRKWHALAYHDHQFRRDIMVAWPLHYLARGFRWLEWRWDSYRHRPGWIDRQAAAAIDRHEHGPRFYR